MTVNGFESPFEALKHIKDKTDLMRFGNNGNFLISAVIDMTEEKHFSDIDKDVYKEFGGRVTGKTNFMNKLFKKRQSWKG